MYFQALRPFTGEQNSYLFPYLFFYYYFSQGSSRDLIGLAAMEYELVYSMPHKYGNRTHHRGKDHLIDKI